MTKPTQWPCRGCGALLSGRGGKQYCGPDCRPRCSVDDCEKPVHSKGLCGVHSRRASRHGDPLTPLQRNRNHGPCGIEGCDLPMRKVGMCANHYAMLKTHGEIRDWLYKWGDGGYNSMHRALQRARGKAANYACADCGFPADEWSYNGGDPGEIVDAELRRFTRNFDAYSPRCVRCHRLYDENPIAMRKQP